jgi:GAF domain-containing protein
LEKKLEARTRELSEAWEQQAATAEVLRIISSSPGDLQSVFETMLENAARLCEAKFGTLFRYRDGAFFPAAMVNAPLAYAEFMHRRGAFQALSGTILDRLVRTREVTHIADDAIAPNPSSPARLGGARSTVAVPMLKDDELIGAVVIYCQELRPHRRSNWSRISPARPSSPSRTPASSTSCASAPTTSPNRCSSRPPPPTCSK